MNASDARKLVRGEGRGLGSMYTPFVRAIMSSFVQVHTGTLQVHYRYTTGTLYFSLPHAGAHLGGEVRVL